MLSTFLVGHRWVTPVLLLVLVVAGLLVGPGLVRRPRLAWALAGLSVLPLLALTLVPTSRELVAGCEVQWAWPTPARVEAFANLVLFVGPVFLAGAATRRWLLAAAAGSASSALVELLQAVVPLLGRSCDTNDWLANTLGSVLGGALALLVLRLARRRAVVRVD